MKRIWLSSAALVGLLAPSAVMAQQDPTGSAQESAEVANDRAAAQGEDADIIVTATRRNARLLDVPISLTSLSADSLEAAGVSEMRELTQAVPALNFSRRNQVFQPTIRGIGTAGASAGEESSVSIYIDGVYQPEMYSGSFDVLKVDRIEVLRGPQGTLFGRNSAGGAISVITPDPTQETHVELSGRFGNFGERSVQGYATTGLGEDVAMDIAGRYYEDDGYVRDLVRGGRTGDRRSIALRTRVQFAPAEDTRATLAFNYSNTHDNSAVSVAPLARNSVLLQTFPNLVLANRPWETSTNILPALQTEQFGLSLRVQIPLFSGVALETTSAAQFNDLFVRNDLDGTSVQLSSATSRNPSRWLTQEIRLLSQGESRFQWTAGFYGLLGDARLDPVRVTSTSLTTGVSTTSNQFSKTVITSGAAFAEGTYRVGERLHLTAGLRYTTEHRSFNAVVNGVPRVDAETSFNAWTPRVAALFNLTNRVSLFAGYSRGFKSGVFNTQSTIATAVRPETVDSFEAGVRAQFFNRINFSATGFLYNYRDLQVNARDPITLLSFLQNAADASGRGGEVEVSGRVVGGLSLRFNAAYLEARYDSFPAATVTIPRVGGGNTTVIRDVSGNDLQRAPRFTFNVGADYEAEVGIGTMRATVNYFRSTRYFWDPLERLIQPSYDKLNARLSLTLRNNIELGVWGENLTNSVVYTQILTSTNVDYAGFERPRSYGVSAGWRF